MEINECRRKRKIKIKPKRNKNEKKIFSQIIVKADIKYKSSNERIKLFSYI